MPSRIIGLIGITVVGLGSLSGCGPQQASGPKPSPTGLPPEGRSGQPPEPIVGTASDALAMTAVLPLGYVPYDENSLPIISPDGRWAATEAGVAPPWRTVVAEPGAPVPEATRIEIYELTYGTGAAGEAVYRQTLTVPALVGRSCDPSGFLVELQNGDGSRWIGKASWETGGIDWQVRDGNINAFATMGPNGRLAWSSCSVAGGPYDLVVRGADGQKWTLSTGDDWLMPTWIGRGDSLFALRLRGSVLELVHMVASSPIAARQSMRTEIIDTAGSMDMAWQVLITQPVVVGGPAPMRDELLFFHPRQNRVMLWRPGSPRRALQTFDAGTFTGLMDGEHMALVTTEKQLERVSLLDPRNRVQVLGGTVIPRRTLNPQWPYIMLEPSPGTGRIGLTAVNLLLAERGG